MDKPTLRERANQFDTLSLPGQSMAMHMGTYYLVHDLWREVERLRKISNGKSADLTWPDGEEFDYTP